MIRGIKTSEFWAVVAMVLNLLITQYTTSLEQLGTAGAEGLIGAFPSQIWLALGGALTAGLYAIGRGFAKGLGS